MLKIITTEDGSHSLFDEGLNETYHSTRGAKGESTHVFIKEGLEYWLSKNQKNEVRILEVGLGTGLNVFLTELFAEEKNLKVHFTSLEPFPIERSVYEKLNFYETKEEQKLLLDIHKTDWEKDTHLTPDFTLFKTISKLEDFSTSQSFHLIYFDAFAPSKQSEIWSPQNLAKCYSLLENGGALTTYCAQGQFKRNLAKAGFEVETLQGAMGKKEMVRGAKI